MSKQEQMIVTLSFSEKDLYLMLDQLQNSKDKQYAQMKVPIKADAKEVEIFINLEEAVSNPGEEINIKH
jgi:hypothetical protein